MRILAILLISTTAFAADPKPPELRLPDTARPLRYLAELTIVPTEESFKGAIEIDVEAKAPLSILWLSANDLTVARAEATVAGKKLAARVVSAPRDFVGLAFDPPLPSGATRVRLEYTGRLWSKDSSGAMRQKEGDHWYVFTQFEPLDARRVFPCFDEPGYKVPWKLVLNVSTQDLAFANGVNVSVKPRADGLRRVEFAETQPLPSYLIAFAVGPFDVVQAGLSSKSQTQVRILTPKGMAEQTRWAKESVPQVLDRLEEWFGTPYPYGKLDFIAVPLFGGAMENPGLITFNMQSILRRPAEETVGWRRGFASVAIHELAHQWFGDLVTMAWWDDLWLNEAFATWMTPKIVESWQPGWGAVEERVQRRSGSMGVDSLVSARKIRQPIASRHDIHAAFDGITYGKGASVIHMFEQWVGVELFQKGVQKYLAAHAHKNATAADFLRAISEAAGRDVAAPFATFLDQPGAPLVSFDLRCRAKNIALKQERYFPAGSTGNPAEGQWQIPICVRHPKGRACTLLRDREGELPLDSCPAWLVPNEGGSGYYRSQMAGMSKLLSDGGKKLSVAERVAVIGDLSALVRAGKIDAAEVLALVPVLSKDPSRHVIQNITSLLAQLRDGRLLSSTQRPAYLKLVRDSLGARARALGWLPRKTDDEDTRILRNFLVPLVADHGEDPVLIAEANKLAAAWVADHAAVDAEAVDGVLAVAAQNGDRARFDAWLAAARVEKDRLHRRRLLTALGAFRDPALVKQALALLLDENVERRDAHGTVGALQRWPDSQPLVWSFVKEKFEALVARMPRDSEATLVWTANGLCDEGAARELDDFFRERASKYAGGPRQLAQALESLRLCAAVRARQSPSVAKFFTSKR